MKQLFARKSTRFALWTLAIYLASYPVLWGEREVEMYALTTRGCFRRVSRQFSIRYDCIEFNPRLRAFVSCVYRPLNWLRPAPGEVHWD